MKTSQKGIDLIKKFEGCRLQAYRCPAGVWTIGYGHTADVTAGQVITQTQAEAFLREDLQKYEKKVLKYYDKYGWNQNEFDALVSFAYNVGSIDGLTGKGTRSRSVIAAKLLQYNKASGKILSGLTRRRKAEKELFLRPVSTLAVTNPVLRKGSRGQYVLLLQQYLNKKGFGLTEDGIFGNKTLKAVRDFQAGNKIKIDGIVGKKTWDRLLR